MAALVALIAGLILGSTAALMRNKWPDRVIVFFSTLAAAVPSFVLASLLLLVFCIQLQWIPVWSTQKSELHSSDHCTFILSDGVHYPSDKDEYA